MKAITFAEANKILIGPGCFDLPVHNDGSTTTSVWQLEQEDIANLAKNGGLIILQVQAGASQPPVCLLTSAVV